MRSSDPPSNATTIDEVPYANVHPSLLGIWVAVGIAIFAIGALVLSGIIAVAVWRCRNHTRHDRGKWPCLLVKDEVLLNLLLDRVDCTMQVDNLKT